MPNLCSSETKNFDIGIYSIIKSLNGTVQIQNPFSIIILNLPIDLENDLLIKIMTRIIEFDFANFLHLKNVSLKIIFDPLLF